MALSDREAALLGHAADVAGPGIFVADGQSQFVAVNQAACDLLGYTREELLALSGKGVTQDPVTGGELYAQMVEAGSLQGITALRHRDGSTVLVNYDANRIPDTDLYVGIVTVRRVIPADVSPQAAAARGPRTRGSGAPTVRETEILTLMSDGLENEEIAHTLYLAVDTVKTHISRLLHKLGARSRAHAVAIALRRGYIE